MFEEGCFSKGLPLFLLDYRHFSCWTRKDILFTAV
jgi:hypothetical protein